MTTKATLEGGLFYVAYVGVITHRQGRLIQTTSRRWLVLSGCDESNVHRRLQKVLGSREVVITLAPARFHSASAMAKHKPFVTRNYLGYGVVEAQDVDAARDVFEVRYGAPPEEIREAVLIECG